MANLLKSFESLDILKSGDIYGAWEYISLFAGQVGGAVRTTESRRIYSFKANGKYADLMRRVTVAVSEHFGCDAIVAIPGHSLEPSRLQKLFGNVLRRTRVVTKRKYCHKEEFKADYSETFEISGEIKGKSVLLVDDVCTTGKSLDYFAGVLEERGHKVIKFALGIKKRKKAETAFQLEVASNLPEENDGVPELAFDFEGNGSESRSYYNSARWRPPPPRPEKPKKETASVAERVARHVSKHNELGKFPDVNESEIIRRIIDDPVLACWHYFPKLFTRKPSDLTVMVIKAVWSVILNGGNQAIAIHRGGGKTTITRSLILLAGLCGIIKYAVFFSSSGKLAKRSRSALVRQLERNPRLLEDFPAACIPIRALAGRAQRAAGQTYRGERTFIEYEAEGFKLASIEGYACLGFKVQSLGIESGFLGLTDDGVRPDFILLDDIQSLEASKSDSMVQGLEDALRQGVQGLGGVENPLRIVVLATCTREGDFSDRVLSPEIYPEYSGIRPGFVLDWGKGLKLWEQYSELWKQDNRDGDKAYQTATAFYRDNRAAMDDGVKINDPDFYVVGIELSAIQHAWNERMKMGEKGYFAQIENRPLSPRFTLYDITPQIVASATNGLKRGECPKWATGLFAFSDVGNDKLRWSVVAFGSRLRAAVIDYGQWPDRGIIVEKSTTQQVPTDCLWRAMSGLCATLAHRPYTRDGKPMRLFALAFDRGYAAESVQKFCNSKSTSYPFPLTTCRGNSWIHWRPSNRNTIRAGWNTQMVRTVAGESAGEFINVRTDFWKETVQRAFLGDSPDAPGACTLWGNDNRIHQEFADQICGETLADKGRGANGTEFWKFVLRPGSENHYLDTLVGCYALAGFYGVISISGEGAAEQGGAEETPSVATRAAVAPPRERRRCTYPRDDY